MSTTKAKRTGNSESEHLDVIVVGAGFAGLYLLDRLRSMGMAVQVFETGGRSWRRLVLELLSWGPRRFSRPNLSIFARRPVAEMAVQRTLSVMAGTPRVFPLRRRET
jgi:choline dehydrogenase-like flavoprotein